MKIGIYGGTFDPPHLGHMYAAQAAMSLLELDKLILVPAKQPPHKALGQDSATPQQRLDMVRLTADALLAPDKVTVDDLELGREGKSYTSDTLRQMRKSYPQDELWLLMGTDMFLTVQDWHESETVMSLANIAAFARSDGDSPETLERQKNYLTERFGAKVELLRLPRIYEISSTQVRQRGDGADLLPSVWGYILQNGLYGVQKDLKRLDNGDLRACSLSMVYAKRHAHILGVEEEAVKLARRWGADEELARRAGILHDCTKYWPTQRHLDYCREYGVELDALELKSEKLLHAKTGALVARHIFGQPDEVYDAIYCHTTGKADMTVLDKIIYIADYMEPNRDFPGVDKLRALAYQDLDAAVVLGCEMSIQEMEEKEREVHPNTRSALESLRH